jgi:DNA polymerase III gamma/tau subunit
MSSIQVEKILIESHGINSDKAGLLAKLSKGCLGWALMSSDNDSHLQQRTQRITALYPLLKAGFEERFDYVSQFGSDRRSAEELIKLWLNWWRDIMLVKYNCKQAIVNVDSLPAIEEWAQVLSLAEISDFMGCLHRSLDQISKNANIRLVLEVLMLDMPKKEGVGHGAVSMPCN